MPVLSSLNLRLLLVLAIAILAGFGAWQNRGRRGSQSLTAFLVVLAVLVAAHLLAHLTAGPLEHLFIKLRWTGLFALPFFVLAFALVFTRHDALLSQRGTAALFAIPAFIAAFIWTPTLLNLVGIDLLTSPVRDFLNQEGPIYYFSVVAAYLALLAASVLILYHSYQVHDRFRRQGWVLAGGIMVLWVGTLIEVFNLLGGVHVHWVQTSFLIFGLAVLWAVYRGGVTDITPLARSRILETLEVAILVIDDRGTITDVNPAAEHLIANGNQRVVGKAISDVLPNYDQLFGGNGGNANEEIELETPTGRQVLSPHITPLRDASGDQIGRVLLLYDVTEERRQREELRRQNERLDDFARVVSHDLRNPLNVALGRLHISMEGSDSEHLEQVKASLERMATLIDDLQELASAGEAVGDLEALELAAVIESCWPLVETHAAELVLDTEAVVQADKTRLQQLLTNLFRNAVEHGGPEVTIRVGDLPAGFYVEDDGPGIPDGKRSEVLEPGYTSAEDGTGFGLSIVRDVAQAHDWELTVTESETGGARFEFSGVEAAS